MLHWQAGLEIVSHFEFRAILGRGLCAISSGHVWTGKPKGKESERATVSLVSGKDDLQVSSCGTLVGNFVAPLQREFWKEKQD